MSIKKRFIALQLLLGVVIWLLPFFSIWGSANPTLTITASSTDRGTGDSNTDASSSDIARIRSMIDAVNENLGGWGKNDDSNREYNSTDKNAFLQYDGTDNSKITITVNISRYKELTQNDKQKVMQTTLETIQSAKISTINKNKIYNYVAQQDESVSSLVRQLSDDVEADYASAYSLFRPFSGVVGTVMGLLTLLIFLFLALGILCDIAYITIPGIQAILNNPADKKKPLFISIEAYNAVLTVEQAGCNDYQDPLSVYMKKKVKQFVFIGICLLYLTSGKIFDLVADLMSHFQGILG